MRGRLRRGVFLVSASLAGFVPGAASDAAGEHFARASQLARQNKLPQAEQEYQALVENRATPQGIRQRAEAMLALLLDSAKAAPTAATAPPQLPATAVPQPPVAGPAKGGGPKGAPK